jgi:hypothetical protein
MDKQCPHCGAMNYGQTTEVCPACGYTDKSPRIPLWMPLVSLGGGAILAGGGFFMACASDIATAYEEARLFQVIMWIGVAVMAGSVIVATWSVIKRR